MRSIARDYPPRARLHLMRGEAGEREKNMGKMLKAFPGHPVPTQWGQPLRGHRTGTPSATSVGLSAPKTQVPPPGASPPRTLGTSPPVPHGPWWNSIAKHVPLIQPLFRPHLLPCQPSGFLYASQSYVLWCSLTPLPPKNGQVGRSQGRPAGGPPLSGFQSPWRVLGHRAVVPTVPTIVLGRDT